MRFTHFTCLIGVLLLTNTFGFSFEIEDKKFYKAKESSEILRVISTTDIAAFEPIILEFQEEYNYIDIEYVVASSSETMKAIYYENSRFDLVISSAMDLQTKLANDGFALRYKSVETEKLPKWTQWRNQVFGFTQEPAVMVISKK